MVQRVFSVMVCIFLIFLLMTPAVFAATKDKPIEKKIEKTPVKQEESKQSSDEKSVEPPEEPVLKIGMKGEEVRIAQKLLAQAGFYSGDIDGDFGEITLRAVKEFQQSNSLPIDGTIGKEVFAHLHRYNAEPSRYSRVITMRATAYSAYDPGNSNHTARGNLLRRGLVAVDPGVIPLGTRLYIRGYGYAIADDVGGAIKGNKIDLAFNSHAEAIQFGVQYVTVYILD